VNIQVTENANEDETAILGNLFFNGGRGSVIARYGEKLHIGMLLFTYVKTKILAHDT
jgi:hypothetical protein